MTSLKLKFFLILLVVLSGFCAGRFAYLVYQSSSIDLLLDMEVDRGGLVEVYINNNFERPYCLPLSLGERHVYRFSNVPRSIRHLRIDPADDVQADVKIYRIAFSYGEKELLGINGADLQRWNLMNIRTVETGGDFFHIETLTKDPIVTQDVDYTFNKDGAKIFRLFPNSSKIREIFEFLSVVSNISVLILVFGILILIILGAKSSYYLVGCYFLMCVCILVAANKITLWFLSCSGEAPSARYAVGNASYVGYSKALELRAFFMAALVAILIGVLFFFVRQMCEKNNLRAHSTNDKLIEKSVSLPFLLFSLALLAILGFPRIAPIYSSLQNIRHFAQWDSLNGLNWQYKAHMGWLPFKDFWYPYGSLATLETPFPWEMTRFFLFHTVIFGLFFIAIYWLVNKNKWWTLIITGSILFLTETNYIQAASRYFISLDYVLLFLVLQNAKKSGLFYYALYGIFAGVFFIYDPIYFIYAGLPVFILFIIHLIKTRDKIQRSFYLKKIMLCAVIFTSFILADIILLWRHGQCDGFIYFYQHLGTHSVSCAVPSGLKDWFKLGLSPNNLVACSILFLIGYGSYLSLVKIDTVGSKCGEVLLSIGLLSFVVFQKNLIRPHIARQIIGICIVAWLLCFYYWFQYWNRRQKYAAIFFFVFLLGFEQANWQPIVKRYFGRLPHLFSDVKVLTSDRKEIEQRIDTYFSVQSFQNYSGVNEFWNYYNEFMKTDSETAFYILGDESFFYILTKQKPPYQVTFYDGCNIFDQHRMVDWLEKDQIVFVIWNTATKDFDGVPNLVRVPIIFNYIVSHYEPYGSFSDYQVLKRKDINKPIDIKFWSRYLGDSIDLGHLPSISSISEMSNCGSPALSECCDFLKVKVTGDKVSRERTVQVKVGDFLFKILFWQNQSDDVYYVYLDRIWFWDCLKQENLMCRLDQNQDEDIVVDILHRKCECDILY